MKQARLLKAVIAGSGVIMMITMGASPGSSETTPQIEYEVVAGSKPQYFEDPGQFLTQSLSLGLSADVGEVSLGTGVTSVTEPYRHTGMDDSALSLRSLDFLPDPAYRLNLLSIIVFPTSRESQEKKLNGSSRLGVSLGVLQNMPVRVGTALSINKYFFKYTKDSDGEATRDFDVRASLQADVPVANVLLLSAGVAQIRRILYDAQAKDFYESFVRASVAVGKTLQFTSQLITSESLVKDGQRNNVKLFERNITQAEIGFAYSLSPSLGGRFEN